MSFDFTEEQKAFVKVARDFARQEFAPNAALWDAEEIFPRDKIRQAGALGFLSLYVPVEAGGMGLSRLDASLIIEELAAGCTSTAAFISIHNMVLWMIATFGNEQAKAKFIPLLLAGESLASYCLTEPDAGSDAAALATLATDCGEHYSLSGAKSFISGAGDTEVLVVMARVANQDGATVAGAGGISSFVVDAKSDGISYGNKEKKMGWNSQPTRQIYFNAVRVEKSMRLGAQGEGFKIAMKGLDGGRINIAACSLGAAQAALNSALSYLKQRKQFGKPLAEFQAVQFSLADMVTDLIAARQMVRMAAAQLDRRHPEATALCAMAKRLATDAGFRICNEALQLHGGYGYLKEFAVERHVRDTRVHQILEGTNQIMRVIIARQLLQAETMEHFID